MGLKHSCAVSAVVIALSIGGFAQKPAEKESSSKNKPRTATRTPASTRKRSAPPAAAMQPPVATPPQPVTPLRPYQMPAVAPEVGYANGQLTIVAQNSTLSSILAAVRARTGAQIERPADTANDRVVVKLGPGNPRDVLASLLQGSRFDYIVLGSAEDPNAVSQVILTPRGPAGGTAGAQASAGTPPASPAGSVTGAPPSQPGFPLGGGTARPELREEEEPNAEAQPVPEPEPPVTAPPAMAAPSGQTGAQPNQPGQPKTPEQLLQELQQMQQQQQQRQQQEQPQQPQPPRQGRRYPPQS